MVSNINETKESDCMPISKLDFQKTSMLTQHGCRYLIKCIGTRRDVNLLWLQTNVFLPCRIKLVELIRFCSNEIMAAIFVCPAICLRRQIIVITSCVLIAGCDCYLCRPFSMQEYIGIEVPCITTNKVCHGTPSGKGWVKFNTAIDWANFFSTKEITLSN